MRDGLARRARPAVPAALTLVVAIAVFAIPRLVVLPQNPSGLGLGSEQATPVFALQAGLIGAAAILSLRFRCVALTLLITAFVWLVTLVAVEFRPIVGLLPAAVAAAGLLVGWVEGASGGPILRWRRWLATIAAGGIVSLIGIGVAAKVFDDHYGPTHPESLRAEPDWVAEWLWVGAVESDRAEIVAGGLQPGEHQLTYWSDDAPPTTVAETSDEYGLARFELAVLSPETEYSYRVERVEQVGDLTSTDAQSDAVDDSDSTFRTTGVGPQDVTVVLGSCARIASNGAVFDAMKREDPDLFLSLGDMHYGNLESDEPADHIEALGRSLRSPAQSGLFSSVSSVWVWDDHDFGDNDSDASNPARDAVSTAYRSAVPHYGVAPDVDEPISQAFTIGRVRFVVTDTRSMRTQDSMLGADQEAWLVDELTTASETHALVVWANPAPWIVDGFEWGLYTDERTRIANALSEARVSNLVMVSGDLHQTAIDDGTNSGYADDGGPGVPVLHAGPLDRPGNDKGGPYSHGSFIEGGQFGVVNVIDDGGPTISVTLTGKSWTGATLTSLDLEIDVPNQ